MKIKSFFSILVIVVLIASCSKSSGNGGGNGGLDCSAVPNKNYSAHVSPIITTRCTISGCHAGGSSNGPGELLTYQQIFNARVGIRNAVGSGLMPQGSSLSTAQINTILCWIDSGAPNN